MKQRIVYSLEILLSLVVVGGLLWVAFFVKPKTEVAGVEIALFGFRNNFYGVVVPDAERRVIWAVGTGGRVIRSEDAGQTWTLQDTPTQNNLQDIAAWDESAALAVGDEGTVLVTEDAGQTWFAVEVPLREFGEQLLQARVAKGTDHAWITGTFGTLFQSLDRGANWEMIHPEVDVAWNDVARAPDGSLWVVGEFGQMRRTRARDVTDSDGVQEELEEFVLETVDDLATEEFAEPAQAEFEVAPGVSWEDVDVGTDISLMSIAFADENHAVAVGLSGTVAHTTDGGETWQVVPTGIESHLFDVTWTGSNYAAVGDAGMVGRASRNGDDWEFSRLAENNFSWYTAAAAAGPETLYISGANLGVLENGNWRQFQEQTGP